MGIRSAKLLITFLLIPSLAYGAAIQGKEEGSVVGYCKSIDFVGGSQTLTSSGLDCTLTSTAGDVGGDVGGVGDCSGGACLDGSSDGGTYVRLYDGDSHYMQVGTADLSANKTFNVGSLTDAKWCKYSSTGTVMDCNVDPVTDTNTTYTASGTLLQLSSTAFSLKEGTLTNGKFCTYSTTSGLVCTSDANNYSLPTATDSVLGGVKVGSGLSITEGVLSATGGGYTNLTSFVDQTNWRLFYSDGSGDVKELALGSDGEYLKSNGTTSAPSWGTPTGGAHDAVTLAGQDYLSLATQQITANLINGDNINWSTIENISDLNINWTDFNVPDASINWVDQVPLNESDPVFTAWDKDYADLINTPTIPDNLSDLSEDATHRTVTDTEKSTWNGKQDALIAGTDYQTPLTADTHYLTPTTAASTYQPLGSYLTAETDPKISTLTNGKWCTTNGSVITCNVDPVTDTNTTYTASGTLLDLSTTTFSVKAGMLTDTKGCKYTTASGIVCDQDYLTSVASDSTWTGHNSYPSACSAGQFVSAIGDTLTCGTPAGDVTAASAFAKDNVLVKSDGTGKGVQATGIIVDDNDNIFNVNKFINSSTDSSSSFVEKGNQFMYSFTDSTNNAQANTFEGIVDYSADMTVGKSAVGASLSISSTANAYDLSYLIGMSAILSNGYYEGGTTTSQAVAGSFISETNSGNTVTDLIGGQFSARVDTMWEYAGDVVSNLIGGDFLLSGASGTITTAKSINVDINNDDSFSPTNSYGVYINDIDVGTNKWNLYSEGTSSVNVFEGKVGIGASTTPTTPLYITGADNGTAVTVKINAAQASVTAADTFIDFRSTTGSEGSIAGTASAGVIAYNTFTGSHFTQITNKTGLELYSVLEVYEDAKIVEKNPLEVLNSVDVKSSVINYETKEESKSRIVIKNKVKKDKDGNPILKDGTVLYKSLNREQKESLSQNGDGRFSKEDFQTEDVIEEIISVKEYQASPKQQLFKSAICSTKASKKAIGVYGGTDKEGRDMVLSIGTGFIIVANKGSDISIGDYLVSSDIKGLSELQSDDIYRSSTIAKATESIKWEEGETRRTIRCIYLGG